MGQQQFLLIVMGIILVAIALAVGINLVTSSAEQKNIDALTSDLIQLYSIARVHYYRPVALGGGGYSYVNFRIPEALKETENGTIKQIKKDHKPDHIYFEATGNEKGENGVDPIIIEAEITIDDIELTVKGKKDKKEKKTKL